MTPRILIDRKWWKIKTYKQWLISGSQEKDDLYLTLDPNQEPEGEDARNIKIPGESGTFFIDQAFNDDEGIYCLKLKRVATTSNALAPTVEGAKWFESLTAIERLRCHEISMDDTEVLQLVDAYQAQKAELEELKNKLEFEYEVQEACYQERKGLKAELEKTQIELGKMQWEASKTPAPTDGVKDFMKKHYELMSEQLRDDAPTDGDWETIDEWRKYGDHCRTQIRRKKVEPTMPELRPGYVVEGNSGAKYIFCDMSEGLVNGFIKDSYPKYSTRLIHKDAITKVSSSNGKLIYQKEKA